MERAGLLSAIACIAWASGCGGSEGPTDPPPNEEVLGVSVHAPTSDPAVATNGLVASYDMTTVTANGRLRDFSANGLHGLIEGTAKVESPRGGGRKFAAATDRIALPAAPNFDLDGPLSIVARFRVDVGGKHQHVIACDDKFVLWLTENDRPRFANTVGDAIEGVARLSTEEWHVVIGIFRGTVGDVMTNDNVELWIDGVRAEVGFRSSTGGAPYIWHDAPLRPENACFIGYESHANDPQHQNLPFFGVIDEVMVFGRALTAQEVATLSVSP